MNPAAAEFRPSSSVPPSGSVNQGGGGGKWTLSGPLQQNTTNFSPSAGNLPAGYLQRNGFNRHSPSSHKEKPKGKGGKAPVLPSYDMPRGISNLSSISSAVGPGCSLRADANAFVPVHFPPSPANFPSSNASMNGNNQPNMMMGLGATNSLSYSGANVRPPFPQPSVLLNPSAPVLPPPHSSLPAGSGPLNVSSSLSLVSGIMQQPLPNSLPTKASVFSSGSVASEGAGHLPFGNPSSLPSALRSPQPTFHPARYAVVDDLSPSPIPQLPVTPSTRPAPVPSNVPFTKEDAAPLMRSAVEAPATVSLDVAPISISSVDEVAVQVDLPSSQSIRSAYVPPHLQPGSGGSAVKKGGMYVPPSSVPSASFHAAKHYHDPKVVSPNGPSDNKNGKINTQVVTLPAASEASATNTSPENSCGPSLALENIVASTNVSFAAEEEGIWGINGESGKISPPAASQVAPLPDPKEEDLPVATPVSFAGSRLPKLFQCQETKKLAPSSPILLSTAWELYADDHQTLLPELLSSLSNGIAGHPAMTHSRPDGPGTGGDRHSGDFTHLVFDPVHIATVKSLEDFWRLWRYVTPPSVCSAPFTYSWFREGILPDWEHPRNRKGGTMSMHIFDRDRTGLNDRQNFDDVFLAVLLACVGEFFVECATTVNGVTLKLRHSKPATLQIWTAHGDFNKLKNFAKSLRETVSPIIGEKPLQKIEFFLHPRNLPPQNSLAARLPKQTGPDHVL